MVPVRANNRPTGLAASAMLNFLSMGAATGKLPVKELGRFLPDGGQARGRSEQGVEDGLVVFLDAS